MEKIPIGIIEDNDDIRASFADHFRNHPDFDCVAAVDSVEKFVKYQKAYAHIRLLVLDIRLPGVSGIEGIPTIRRCLSPEADIVMYTSFDEPQLIFQAICAGATGYLLKSLPVEELEKRMKEVVFEGGSALSPAIARRIVEYFQPPSKKFQDETLNLSDTETQVTRFISDGKSYQDIAQLLGMSVNGIKYHQKQIFKKLNVNSRHELSKWMEGRK
jgi:DNA-binding NarL/FixJ family response regulator